MLWCGRAPGRVGPAPCTEGHDRGHQKRWWGLRSECSCRHRQRGTGSDLRYVGSKNNTISWLISRGGWENGRRSKHLQCLTLAWTVRRPGLPFMSLGRKSRVQCGMLTQLLHIQVQRPGRQLTMWTWSQKTGFICSCIVQYGSHYPCMVKLTF